MVGGQQMAFLDMIFQVKNCYWKYVLALKMKILSVLL